MCRAAGGLRLQPTHSPSAGEAKGLVSRAIAHPPCCTPAEDTAPGAQLAQLNLGHGKGEILHLLLSHEGLSLRKGRRRMLHSLCIGRRNTYYCIHFMARKWSEDIP